MQNRAGNKSISVVNLILLAMAVGLFLFFVDIEMIILRVLALIFIVCAGVVLVAWPIFFAFAARNYSPVFLNAGVSSTLFLYFFATVILAFLVNVFGGNVGLYVVTNLVLIAVTAIVVIIVSASARRIAKNDRQTANAMAFMDDCELRLFNLIADSGNAKYKAELTRLYEDVKYADKVGTSSIDTNVEMELERLEKALYSENSGESGENSAKSSESSENSAENRTQADIGAILSGLGDLLRRRKGEISKRGGF